MLRSAVLPLAASFTLVFPLVLTHAAEPTATPSTVQTAAQLLPLGISPQMVATTLPQNFFASAAQAALGERLFFDKRLSVDNTVACATCHVPSQGFVDHLPTSRGVGGQHGQRNAPTVLNAMFQFTQFWDGRSQDLLDQAKLPILNPVEMGMADGAAVEAKLGAIDAYKAEFLQLYGALTFSNVAHAITAYERTQASGNAPFDRYIHGDEAGFDAQAKRGWALFNGKARCNACHAFNKVSPLFSDQQFHNIGISAHDQNFAALAHKAEGIVASADAKQIDELALQTSFSELGRFMVSKERHDIGAFKTQTLRNIGVTAPYMHDGSLPTLWDVVDHYNRGGIDNPYLDGGIQRLGLTEAEIDDLVAFLFTLTDDRYQNLNRAERHNQDALRRRSRPQRDTAAAMGQRGDYGDVGAPADQKNPADIGAL